VQRSVNAALGIKRDKELARPRRIPRNGWSIARGRINTSTANRVCFLPGIANPRLTAAWFITDTIRLWLIRDYSLFRHNRNLLSKTVSFPVFNFKPLYGFVASLDIIISHETISDNETVCGRCGVALKFGNLTVIRFVPCFRQRNNLSSMVLCSFILPLQVYLSCIVPWLFVSLDPSNNVKVQSKVTVAMMKSEEDI